MQAVARRMVLMSQNRYFLHDVHRVFLDISSRFSALAYVFPGVFQCLTYCSNALQEELLLSPGDGAAKSNNTPLSNAEPSQNQLSTPASKGSGLFGGLLSKAAGIFGGSAMPNSGNTPGLLADSVERIPVDAGAAQVSSSCLVLADSALFLVPRATVLCHRKCMCSPWLYLQTWCAIKYVHDHISVPDIVHDQVSAPDILYRYGAIDIAQ